MRMQEVVRDGSPSGNWTEVDCGWFDEVIDIQNGFYWRHRGAGNVILLYCLICGFGAMANLFVIASFLRTPHLRNLRNYFIVNLAVSDLMLCLVTAPVTVYFTVNMFWPFGTLACQATASMQAVNMFVSCLTLVLIAMDRFLLTLCPVKWRLAARAPVICYVVTWLLAFLVSAPYFFAVSAEDVQLEPWTARHTGAILKLCGMRRPQICLERTWHRLPFSRRTYTLSVLAIQYILPLAALGFAYSQIGSTIRRRAKYQTTVDQQRKQILVQRNRRALLLLLLLFIIYLVAWLPINAYNVLTVLDVIEFSQSRYILCHMIGMVSACLNPIMYGLINESFRNAFLAMLRPLFAPCNRYIVISSPVPPTQTTMSFAAHPIKRESPNKKSSVPAPLPLHNGSPLGQTPFMEPLVCLEDDQFC